MHKNIILKSSLALLTSLTVIASIGQTRSNNFDYSPINADGEIASCSIDYVNLAFQDSIYFLYAVKVENTSSLPSMYLWTTGDGIYDIEDAIELPIYKEHETINGSDYTLFQYTGLAAKQMTDYLYAKACVDNQLSDLVKYSVLEYATKELQNSSNENLKETLRGMLDYGAGAQKLFNYHTERLANDTFYRVTITDGTFIDGTSEALVTSKEEIQVTTSLIHDGWTINGGINIQEFIINNGDLTYNNITNNVDIKPDKLLYALTLTNYVADSYNFAYNGGTYEELSLLLKPNTHIQCKGNVIYVDEDMIQLIAVNESLKFVGFDVEFNDFYLSKDLTMCGYTDRDLSTLGTQINFRYKDNENSIHFGKNRISNNIEILLNVHLTAYQFIQIFNQTNGLINECLLNEYKALHAMDVLQKIYKEANDILYDSGHEEGNETINRYLDEFHTAIQDGGFENFVLKFNRLLDLINSVFAVYFLEITVEKIAEEQNLDLDIENYVAN